MPNIESHYVNVFSDRVNVIAQQTTSKTKPYVQFMSGKGEKWFYDGLGKVEMRRLTSRHAPVVWDSIDHYRRKITKERYACVLPIDENDVENKLSDPTGLYAQAVAMAAARQFDRIVYAAAFATVYTGQEGDAAVTASSDGVLTVDATGGVAYTDLLAINQNFVDSNVALEEELEPGFFISGDEETAMLQVTQLTSGDYTRQFAVERGRLQMAMGMKIIKFAGADSTPILDVTSGVRKCAAIAQNGIAVFMGHQLEIKVEPRPDVHQTKQVVAIMTLGAARTEGNRVQQVNTTD